VARTIFNLRDRDALLKRLDRLTPDAKARWGRMTAHRMLCHLSDSLRVGLGEVPAESRAGPLANPVARWLLAYVIPFPKGRAETAPEMLTSQPSDWTADLAAAREYLRAAAARGETGKWARHPAFGEVSGKLYGVFIHKHFDHHLRQFGV
jgi:phytoene dehydrogenase-like protein